jgi:hypothetical protein
LAGIKLQPTFSALAGVLPKAASPCCVLRVDNVSRKETTANLGVKSVAVSLYYLTLSKKTGSGYEWLNIKFTTIGNTWPLGKYPSTFQLFKKWEHLKQRER